MLFRLLALLVLLVSVESVATETRQVLTVSAQTERVKLNQQLAFRVTHDNFSLSRIGLDSLGRWESFEQLRSHQIGSDKPLIWAAVKVFNRSRSSQRYIIDFGDSYIDEASVYLLNAEFQVLDSERVEFDDPLVNRPHISQQIMLPVDVPANQTMWLVMSMKQWPKQINTLSLWAPQPLQLHLQQKQTALGVNAGVLLLLAVAAFSLARGTQRKLQISTGLVATAFILVMLLHSGIWITYFSPFSPAIAGVLLPYSKQWLLLALTWVLRECVRSWLKSVNWNRFFNGLMVLELLVSIAQPWWPELQSSTWLSLQISVLVAITALVGWRVVNSDHDRIVKWFVLLLLPLSVIAWLLILPRVNTLWQGLSGIVLYSLLTANMLALILAQLDKALVRLDRRIGSLRRMKDYYRDAYWRFINRSNEGWFELDADHHWRRVSKRFLAILGLNNADFLRRHWPTADALFNSQCTTWNEPQRQESWQHLQSVERIDGKTIWLQIEIFADGRGRILEVTEQVEAEMHLNFLAKHDPLTGLLNQREFHRVLQRQVDQQKDCVVILLHINGLQVIHDQTEPVVRDQALLQMVLNLREKLPQRARIARVAEQRLGIMISDTEQAGFALAYQLIQVCREFRFSTQDRVFQFTAHAGIACATAATLNGVSLLRRAEGALKLAQQLGDFKVHSATADDQQRLLRREEQNWEQRLRDALVNEDWVLYQQVMVSADQNRDKHCYEILLRLPESGQTDPDEALAPQQFLSAALNAGIMGKADRWLVRHVLDYFNDNPFIATRTWRCHINLSIQSLEDSELIHFLEQKIEQSNMRPEQLAFELAEPVVAENFERAYELFKQLQQLGCVTVIDQFGTGFNSFRLLRQMPLTQIKINRFWVQNMLLDAVEAELVLSCIRLAKAAGVEVSAVGVENEETRTALIDAEVDYLQGYVCGRPTQWQPAENTP